MDTPDRLHRAVGRRGWKIGAVVVVAALGVGAYLFSGDLFDGFRSRRRTEVIESDNSGNASKPSDPPAAAGAAGTTVLPATITVGVENAPPGLQVSVDGEGGSLPVRLPRDGAVHKLTFKVPGFQPETRIIEASRSEVLSLQLKPIKDPAEEDDGQARPAVRSPTTPPRAVRRRTPSRSTPRRGDDVILDI
jgi:hypothetical protein